MKLKYICSFLFVISLVFISCKNKRQVPPAELIPYETMLDVLAESYIIEAMTNFSNMEINRYGYTRELYQDLFDEYQITEEQYETSIRYYVSEKEQAMKLYEDVAKKIEERKE